MMMMMMMIPPKYGTLTGIITKDQSGPECNDNKKLISFRTGASLSDGLASRPIQDTGKRGTSYAFAGKQSAYSTALADRARKKKESK